MKYYVTIKTPEQLLSVAAQRSTPTGKTRVRADGVIEAQFIPLDKGYYDDVFWATRDQLVGENSPN